MSQRESWIKQGKCPDCGGDYWAGRGYVGHTEDCPRRQDKEREALSELEAPFPGSMFRYGPIRWPDGPSALSDFVHQKPSWRRQSVAPNYGQDGP